MPKPNRKTAASKTATKLPEELLCATVALLGQAKGRIVRRSIASEAQVDLMWLNKVAQGDIKDPGVQKVERVYRYLSVALADQGQDTGR